MSKTNSPRLSAILAMSENRVIGKNNQLPWHLPADLKHFKTITTGHPIIMGRKTYESIGKPLPNRTNIIMTRQKGFDAPGCIVVRSLAEAMLQIGETEEIFIIGGAEIYHQTLSAIQRIYLTIIHHTFDGDAYFPELNRKEWREIKSEQHEADEKNLYAYSFVILERMS